MAPIGGHKCFLGNIASSTDVKDVRKVAEAYGPIKTMFYNADNGTQNLGWAFITFQSPRLQRYNQGRSFLVTILCGSTRLAGKGAVPTALR